MSSLPQVLGYLSLTPPGFREDVWRTDCLPLPLAIGQISLQGEIACLDPSTFTVKTAAAGNANLLRIGRFVQNLDNSQGGSTYDVLVKLTREIAIEYFDNDTVTPVTTRFQPVFAKTGRIVTGASIGNAPLGICWDIDAIKGIGIGPSKLEVMT
jgi:hypothetical protein